jgi:hypothetical protein
LGLLPPPALPIATESALNQALPPAHQSALICGGNLISGFAHSRDLLHVSPWLKRCFTDENIFNSLARCEAHGINTAILRLDDDTLRFLKTHWKERDRSWCA